MAVEESGRYVAVVTEDGRYVKVTVTENGRKVRVSAGTQFVNPDFIGGFIGGYPEGYAGQGSAVFAPSITTAQIAIPLINRTGATFAPTVTSASGPQVLPGLINVGAGVFAPVVVGGAPPETYIPGLLVEFDRDNLSEFGFVLDDPVKSLLDSGNTLDRVTTLTWEEDITPYVRSGSTSRGADRELQRTEAGTGHILLDNRDARFTPFFVGSPYFPDILPLKRIRIQATWQGTTYPVFMGYAESWPVTFPAQGDNVVTVQLVDGLKLLAQVVVSESFAQQSTGQRIEAVLLAAGFAPSEMSIEVGVSTVAAVTLENANVLEHIQTMAQVEQGRFFVSRAGIFTFVDRQSSSQPDLTTRTWADDGSGMSYRDITFVFDDSLILNDVRLTREGGTEQVVQDSTSAQQYGTHSLVQSNLPLSDDAQVLDLAQRYIDRYAQPELRIEGLVDNGMQHQLWGRVLGREMGDVVQVKETETDLAQVSAVEGIAHDFGQNTWTVSLRVSPTVVDNYARLDDAAFRLDDNFILGR